MSKLSVFLLNYSCKPTDDFDTSAGVMLEFSVDTLRFDTVFTELRIMLVQISNRCRIYLDHIKFNGFLKQIFGEVDFQVKAFVFQAS